VPGAYAPADLQAAYGLTDVARSQGAGTTIAIVDAFDNPNAEADLNAYRAQYGLGPCTTGNGCFRKVDQRGATIAGVVNAPRADVGWGQEIDLDIEMASAACPLCKILLVEADDNSFASLGAAVSWAAGPGGADVISNSYGAREFSGETSTAYNAWFKHPGVAITVSSGDGGYGVEFPAASPYVTAVGGTTLRRATTGRGWSETAWKGAGSGCSAYVARPWWQPSRSDCARRRVSDVSAVADPVTGVSVYDSFGSSGGANWYVFGGTSVAAPIVAGVFALADSARTVDPLVAPYANTGALFDVVSGSNGKCNRTPALCTAGPGWDGPTGLGTPNGAGAF
jgi:subtilase family serine protease